MKNLKILYVLFNLIQPKLKYIKKNFNFQYIKRTYRDGFEKIIKRLKEEIIKNLNKLNDIYRLIFENIENHMTFLILIKIQII